MFDHCLQTGPVEELDRTDLGTKEAETLAERLHGHEHHHRRPGLTRQKSQPRRRDDTEGPFTADHHL